MSQAEGRALGDLGRQGVGVPADLVPDDLWGRVAPLPPPHGACPWAGQRRRPSDDKQNHARLQKAKKAWGDRNVFHHAQSIALPG
ncbi:BBE domain-containing protein [Kitasatospora sp. NPDC050467]|uniref:BBE domain-containing protein n=1 Tax=unclassified Kitasatospora TaxID=2633591 RepID=UPI003795F78A